MDVYCFDFDGVVCDSAPETALAAWNASAVLWPERFAPDALPKTLQDHFCRMRPVLHTGFEAVPLLQIIASEAVSDAEILTRFSALRDAFTKKMGLTEAQLKKVFAQARDKYIATDREGWLRANPFYPGVKGLLSAAIVSDETYMITTKQERFVALLFAHNGIAMPMERVYGLDKNLSKPAVLAHLMAAHPGGRFHFIEDRFDTLEKVMGDSALDAVRLYLAGWGYNTPQQRQQVADSNRIEGIASVEDLRQKLGL